MRRPRGNVELSHKKSSTTDYEELTYDNAGNVTSRRLRDGQSIAFTYDLLNRPTRKDVPSGAYGEYDVSYAWDNLSRLTAAASDLGHVASFTYDALGRVTSETGPLGTKTMQYDLAGRMTRLSWPDAFQVGYSHLVTGEVSAITESPAGTPFTLATFTYDDRGRRTLLSRGNGTTTSYSYDPAHGLGTAFPSALARLVQDLGGGTADDLTLRFGYNPAGQIVGNHRDNDAYSFTAHANLSRADTHNGLNQILATGTTGVTHDARVSRLALRRAALLSVRPHGARERGSTWHPNARPRRTSKRISTATRGSSPCSNGARSCR